MEFLPGLSLYQGFKGYIDGKLGEAGLEKLKKQAETASNEAGCFRAAAQKSSVSAASLVESLKKLGAAEGLSHERVRIVSGSTSPEATEWRPCSTPNVGVFVYIDTSAAGFTKTPQYLTSLGGFVQLWDTRGATCIYEASPKGFKVFIRWAEPGGSISVAQAKAWKYHINWVVIGE